MTHRNVSPYDLVVLTHILPNEDVFVSKLFFETKILFSSNFVWHIKYPSVSFTQFKSCAHSKMCNKSSEWNTWVKSSCKRIPKKSCRKTKNFEQSAKEQKLNWWIVQLFRLKSYMIFCMKSIGTRMLYSVHGHCDVQFFINFFFIQNLMIQTKIMKKYLLFKYKHDSLVTNFEHLFLLLKMIDATDKRNE